MMSESVFVLPDDLDDQSLVAVLQRDHHVQVGAPTQSDGVYLSSRLISRPVSYGDRLRPYSTFAP